MDTTTTTEQRTRGTSGTTSRKVQVGKTPADRAAEVEALAEQLTDTVTALTTSAAWLEMLRVAARFTRYSSTNVLLLWMQAEQRGVTLSRVAGYRAWQAIGRQVVKGARSFAVKAPVRRRLTLEEATERARSGQRPAFDADGRPALVVRGFKLERVFRYEDTEGEPLPEVPEVGYVTGDTPTGAWDALSALVTREGYQLTAEAEDGDTRGHTDFTRRVVNIDPRYHLAERVHILVHELGHIRCDHENRRKVSRAQRETEAESVAFIVCSVLGLELGDVAAVYVGGWTDGDPDTITAAQVAIHTAARGVLADLEDNRNEHGDDEDVST
ncbi:ArdC-like ssDNA-binding domain-containing protein [Pseudonocardia charpentierae]|uniref:ArdC-like ssDNA-binding domain-containing protein n=1 Tax=Pseudonocardia charpentierae TaxID=3075545 RepID=A0ABU2N2I6_9PSEU|nr:ArdC-like ssDNA-binding domain-containing protein [Pseudonocardia sp. DSM 45834]MDT0348131.1 ArdC-like ssDNA-binding domain-containing protein [Pseudonocardia sp. DSM 45834]